MCGCVCVPVRMVCGCVCVPVGMVCGCACVPVRMVCGCVCVPVRMVCGCVCVPVRMVCGCACVPVGMVCGCACGSLMMIKDRYVRTSAPTYTESCLCHTLSLSPLWLVISNICGDWKTQWKLNYRPDIVVKPVLHDAYLLIWVKYAQFSELVS